MSYRRLLVSLDQLNRLIEDAKEQLGGICYQHEIVRTICRCRIYYDQENLNNVVIYHQKKPKALVFPASFLKIQQPF